MYDLQSRWKYENGILKYYGLRKAPNMLKNTVKLNAKQKEIIGKLPCELTDIDKKVLGRLLSEQVVLEENIRVIPHKLADAVMCKNCVANDYIIPGLELDEEGLCPICQTQKQTENLRSVVPIMNNFPQSKKSRFDIAVFYTGGKDSTYLLYYLSKILKLRVLALTWEIPYMSSSARKSIENAKAKMDSVEFITRKVANDDLRKIYRYLYSISGNTCACPSLAYLLFYPELVANRVLYFVAGNEPSQLLGLYYNHLAPKIAYSFGNNRLLNMLVNIGRVITLRPPLKKGQFQTLATMRQLAYGDSVFKKMSGYSNSLVKNVVESIHQIPLMVKPLKSAIRRSSWSGNIPAFVQVDFAEICGGVYDWEKIKDTIIEECGWTPPDDCAKGLHTSCSIEKCKEYSQFKRFYDMQSPMIPFSAIELAIATRDNSINREKAIKELEESLGFSLQEVPECAIMKEYLR